jgi:hypothetical protein
MPKYISHERRVSTNVHIGVKIHSEQVPLLLKTSLAFPPLKKHYSKRKMSFFFSHPSMGKVMNMTSNCLEDAIYTDREANIAI